jgi:hypothetical protein
MEYSERYFKHIENCECNIDTIKTTVEAAISRRAPYEVDKDGNKLFYVDSFGYRGPIPGESPECYQAMSKARSEASRASSIPKGCTCIYSSNGVHDSIEPDCPIHEEGMYEEGY